MGANIPKRNIVKNNNLLISDNHNETDNIDITKIYIQTPFKKQRKYKRSANKFNTPNNNINLETKNNFITENDLLGFEYSPEVLEESLKKKLDFETQEETNNNIKEFCIENNVSYNQIPFESKLKVFKIKINNLKFDWDEGYNSIDIERENVLKDSLKQLKDINLYKELKINFLGEISYDAGGIIREWFTILFRKLLSPELNLFKRADCDNFSYKINSSLEKSEINLNYFKFIGKLMAKAMLENVCLNTCFNKLIFKMILNEKIELRDLKYFDQELYNSLNYLKSNKESINDLEIFFVIPNEQFGQGKFLELIPNGIKIKLTPQNLNQYISERIKHIIYRDKCFINEIKFGIFSIIPEHFIFVFNSSELMKIINGVSKINLDDWKENTTYMEPFENDYYLIEWFWEILYQLDQKELERFLLFCTGSSRIPITGFKELESNRGNISKFCINFVPYDYSSTFNYIKAHTCFNRIDLPDYPTKKLLEEALKFIISNEILGFGIE